MAYFTTEREGQMAFFDNYGINYQDDNSILVDFTDGVYNGNLFEFKLNISNPNKVLFQAVKYLSKMRVKGESVPATILLIDLNATTVYVYKSKDYFDDIHKIYTGAASKNNEGFIAKPYDAILNYSDMLQSSLLKKILKGHKKNPDEMYMPVNIDENCIVGWAERYYRENPKASKGDFLGDDTGSVVKVTGEIRYPRHFKGLINPYTGKSNEKFKYLMDCLNDRLSKKDLGAFYTPVPYAKKAAELVQMAVERVPDGNDYIILDRCAGTGNLEAALIGLTDSNGDDLIEHCVVSTYEYYEYKVLQERIGDRVRNIIPPAEMNVVYSNGKVANADAMSKEFIENPIIRQYVDNLNCTIILFENPPYADDSGSTTETKKSRGNTKNTYVATQFKQYISSKTKGLVQSKDLINLFIWSGFHYYLRQSTDFYVVFGPIKYWKTGHLVNKEFIKGFLFNRKHFHATDSAISCILWGNENICNKNIGLTAYDIVKNNMVYVSTNEIQQVFKTMNEVFFDKRTFSDSIDGIYCQRNGEEGNRLPSTATKPVYNDNIIAYMHLIGFSFDVKNKALIRTTLNLRKNGFYVRNDNYKEKLPLFVSKLYPLDNWWEKDVVMTSADGGDAYTKDPQFLKSCLIYTCLSNQNKCLSFDGSDGRRYQNELCFDDSRMPLALQDLNRYVANKATALDDEEQRLIDLWNKIMNEARNTKNYNPEFNYGVYQITKELNTFTYNGTGRSKKKVYDYPELNGDLDSLRVMLKAYYKSHITEKMFQYELLK